MEQEQINIFYEIDNMQLSKEELNEFINEHELKNKIDTFNYNIESEEKFTVLSLFAGCGGLDLGLKGGFEYLNKKYNRNNFDIIWANEINTQIHPLILNLILHSQQTKKEL